MIWLWIASAVGITALLLRKKNIAPHNYLWALLPIDMYGITIMGFMLKPVHIFSILLIFYAFIARKKSIKIPRSVLLLTTFLLISVTLSMLFRNDGSITPDINTYLLLFFVIILAAFSVSQIEGRDDLRQIRDVMIATAVGYGIVFLALYSLDAVGITLPDVKSTNTWSPSIIKAYNNVVNGELSQSYRLRGFNVDPNASCMVFIIGLTNLFGEWIKKGNHLRNLFYTMIILTNVVLTSSRAALIICIFIIILSVFRMLFARIGSGTKIVVIGIILLTVFTASVILIYDSGIFSYIYDNVIARYQNRNSLTDEFGRFTLWADALSELNLSNWHCGLGITNVSLTTNAHRDSHNTIVEIFCSSGIIVGISYTLYFLYPLVFALRRRLADRRNAHHLTNFTIAYLGIFTMLNTISNVASLYMIYTAFLLYIIPGCLAKEDEEARLESIITRGRS